MKVFIAAPITSAPQDVGPTGEKQLDTALRTFLRRLENVILRAGHEVFTAHPAQQLGASLRPAHFCTPLDFLAVRSADFIVAYPQQSYGVHMELAWASALRKPIILIREVGREIDSPLLHGLSVFGTCSEVTTQAGFLADESTVEEVCAQVVRMLGVNHRLTPKKTAIAFLSTAFGFGPVSKATTIAAEFRRVAFDVDLDFFGNGIDLDFAAKTGVFDHLFRYDIDADAALAQLAKHLRTYDHVVSVLNFAILRWWCATYPPLYVVDSLAWMWPAMPSRLEKAACYFVQDYLLPQDRIELWRQAVQVVPVAPICPDECRPATARNDTRLLVNFSGCANPLLDDAFYHQYVRVLSTAILDASHGVFEDVLICTRESLHHVVLDCVGTRLGVRIAHLPHDRFLREMSDSGAVLTSPGITTTIEALRLNRPIGFVLPQNYSQCLLAERNLDVFGPSRCMALSRFGEQYRVAEGLPEAVGVKEVARSLEEICKNNVRHLHILLSEMLTVLRAKGNSGQSSSLIPDGRGQELIVRTILSSSAEGHAVTRLRSEGF